MANLLTTPGYDALMHGFTFGEICKAHATVTPIMEDKILGGMSVATAYLIGIRQGVHDERARRKGGAV